MPTTVKEPKPPFPPQHQESRASSQAGPEAALSRAAIQGSGARRKVALITGGDSGIGWPSRCSPTGGANVALILDVEQSDADDEAGCRKEGHEALLLLGDVCDPVLP
jgi:hypothetical protein